MATNIPKRRSFQARLHVDQWHSHFWMHLVSGPGLLGFEEQSSTLTSVFSCGVRAVTVLLKDLRGEQDHFSWSLSCDQSRTTARASLFHIDRCRFKLFQIGESIMKHDDSVACFGSRYVSY